MTELREKVARALYEHFVGEDFLNEYAPWADLEGKEEWLERADVVLALPELAALKLTVVRPLNLGASVSTGTKKDD